MSKSDEQIEFIRRLYGIKDDDFHVQIKSLIAQAEKRARISEAKINLAPLQIPRHNRANRNYNTTRKRGIVAYFNKVMKTRIKQRLNQLRKEQDE